MKKGFLLGVLLGTLIAAGFAVPLWAAGSELDADVKAVSKLGVTLQDLQTPSGLKVKRFCACRNTADTNADHKLGFMVYTVTSHSGFDRIAFECYVPRYDKDDGSRIGSDFCQEWVPLPK